MSKTTRSDVAKKLEACLADISTWMSANMFKVAVQDLIYTFKALQGTAPQYIEELIVPYQPIKVSTVRFWSILSRANNTWSDIRSRDIKFKQSAGEEFSSVYPGINNIIIGRLYRSWEDEFFKTCALHECGDEYWNMKQVYKFERLWGQPGHSFTCYYDPNDVTQGTESSVASFHAETCVMSQQSLSCQARTRTDGGVMKRLLLKLLA
ncbi:hypothetical protein LSH36_545g02009 [Paralvinella palmiformis]|uniref:Uncharacterized protein n=1 Tax=Paralvinella palmiformis TaxID=53620 RepID=A0AAD9J812_9ANNE|nr:hypothetical protein LSH36_545g02009 [Paralvinella palmiformis]